MDKISVPEKIMNNIPRFLKSEYCLKNQAAEMRCFFRCAFRKITDSWCWTVVNESKVWIAYLNELQKSHQSSFFFFWTISFGLWMCSARRCDHFPSAAVPGPLWIACHGDMNPWYSSHWAGWECLNIQALSGIFVMRIQRSALVGLLVLPRLFLLSHTGSDFVGLKLYMDRLNLISF